MVEYLILIIISLSLSGILFIPFISLLYKLKFQNPHNLSVDMLGRVSLFNKLHGHKVGIPTGGGILMVLISVAGSVLYQVIFNHNVGFAFIVLAVTLGSFGLLGLLDDMQKFFKLQKSGVFGLRIRHKFLIQLLLSFVISLLLYSYGGKSVSGLWYIFYSTLVIAFFANAFNITDGLDGLAGGLLMIVLVALWIAALNTPFGRDVATFISILFGTVLAFMYFNISPARLFMGDTGALAFGAFIAVVSLLANISIPLFVIGGVFVVEGLSSLLQWWSLKFRNGKRIFKIAPLHHHFEALGWEEPKVVMRFWLAGIVCALFGLLLGQLVHY